MITPHCPRICRYRYLCNEDRQQLTARMFLTHELRSPKECFVYPGFERRLHVLYGVDVKDKSAVEVRELVVEALKKQKEGTCQQ